ncbi:MAG TPA: hypothetical protein VFO11_07495 [Candidatus Polarisedimenticolaceae bacterium]|nr:hypothetical protein [Candidatus Polarisedimenticolaceae bacterium]
MVRTKQKRVKVPALLELSRFHMRQGDVFETVRRLVKRLGEEGLEYVVAGGLAVLENGYRRATEDIDLVMRPQDLEAFRSRLVGKGYVPAFPGALKSFRDAETGVRIEVLTTGDFPGDGKPKPVAFPDPAAAATEGEDFRYLRLEALLELKLASGMSAPHRRRDLSDVQDLIVARNLPLDLEERLHPSVRDAYRMVWNEVRDVPRETE